MAAKASKLATPSRPLPPADFRNVRGDVFLPARELRDWIFKTFIARDGALFNIEHWHLGQARIGVYWAFADNSKQMRTVIGMVNLPKPISGGAWEKARFRMHLRHSFDDWYHGQELDFLLTISAPYAYQASDAQFCALIEHELYHMAQKRDQYGAPAFHKQTGRALYALRGHDVEEFVGVVRRYGADAAGVRELVDAANKGPQVAAASIAGACGNCLR
jgi:hypothetical protein